jgi:hypothetical protein
VYQLLLLLSALTVGFVVSTVIAALVFVAAGLFAVSFTLFAGNVNVTVPFDHAFHVYVNVNVLFVADILIYYLAIRLLTDQIVHPKNLDKA